VTNSPERYKARAKHDNRMSVLLGIVVFVAVTLLGTLTFTAISSYELGKQHTQDIARTTALAQQVLSLEATANNNHADTIHALQNINASLIHLCQSIPGCTTEGNTP
jgi:hypothetical protein